MRKSILASIVIAFVSAVAWMLTDYGTTKTELAYSEANVEVVTQANIDRDEMAEADAGVVQASIANTKARDTELQRLKDQVAFYEEELQKNRNASCNLAADTIAGMQQHTDGRKREQLGASARVPDGSASYHLRSTRYRLSVGDGADMVDKRGHNRRPDMRPYRPAASRSDTPEAASTV